MKRTKTKKKSSKQPQKGSKPVKWNGDRMRQVYELALLGLTEEVMCKVTDVHIKTFEYWKKTKPALLKTLRDGKMDSCSGTLSYLWVQEDFLQIS